MTARQAVGSCHRYVARNDAGDVTRVNRVNYGSVNTVTDEPTVLLWRKVKKRCSPYILSPEEPEGADTHERSLF